MDRAASSVSDSQRVAPDFLISMCRISVFRIQIIKAFCYTFQSPVRKKERVTAVKVIMGGIDNFVELPSDFE